MPDIDWYRPDDRRGVEQLYRRTFGTEAADHGVEQLLQEFLRVTTAYAVEVPHDEPDAVVPGETEFSPQAA